MEDSDGRRSEFEIHGLSLIDVSSEDDSLLFSSFLDPSINDFSENDKDDKVLGFLGGSHDYDEEIPVSTLEEKEQVLQPHESPEPDTLTKSGKYNLRKSLAWDKAFFTSAGVLEPEELSSMIESNHKGENQSLSTIQEDLQMSTESISTFQSDCTVENCQEFGFFEDIRASIQRSAKASDAATPDKSKELVPTDAATSPMSSMVEDPISQEKMKPKASPKKPSFRVQGLGKATKQPVASRGSSTTTSKPPKVISRVRPMPTTSTKRASLDVSKTKQEKDSKLSGGKQPLGSRISISGSAKPVLPRPVVPSKSSLRSSVASKNELTSSCSSLESCASASSSISYKSSTNLIQKKKDSSSRLASPSFTNRTLPRVAPRNTSQPRIPSLSTKGTSKSKLSSNVSPASSISDRSSESSRASTPNKTAKDSQKTVSGAKGSANNDRPQTSKPLVNSNNETFVRPGSMVGELVHDGTKRVSAVNGGVVHPASMKPTGLRVPSPKIGFFDRVRSAAQTPTGNMQDRSCALSSLSKHGVNSPNGSLTKTKSEKLQPERHPLQESSNSKTKVSSFTRSPRVISVSSPKAQNKKYSKIIAEEQLKGEGDNEEKKTAGNNSSLPSVSERGSSGKQGTGLAKGTKKVCPANGEPMSIIDQNSASGGENMISCIELPKEGETPDKAVCEQSDKSIKETKDMVSDMPSEMEKEFAGDESEDTSLKRTPLLVNSSAHGEDGMLTISERVVEVAENPSLTPLENIPEANS
ncbi:PREDICTED: cell wall protein RBR3 isoform X2 [Tarenaya hassleriana]|uniref:cell wall protein RBR3 isoform X2 n=1 Tax=Tarenaya hassleriana TaxID=28532 RepID=UPI00053C0925|nr:PREDICTED: cell wall protein RBR3 isoform X2 [Tarenaya hassleriana]